MTRPQQRYRGVRQRHWGSWVSEIRHPLLKTRIWLGTFETAENAALAYDEAARLMCGSSTRTNFPYNPNASPSSASKIFSATLTAKLHKCYLASLQMAKNPSQEPKREPNHSFIAKEIPGNGNIMEMWASERKHTVPSPSGNEVNYDTKSYFKSLEDDQIDQMIEELLHYGSIEFSPLPSSNWSSRN